MARCHWTTCTSSKRNAIASARCGAYAWRGSAWLGSTSAGDASCVHGAHVVDLQGRYLMPGLIDMHAHLTLGPLELKRERGRMVMQALADDDIAQHNARRLVAFGVTTLRNPGGDLAAAARYKARLAAGELVGPETFNAGPVINNADLPGLAMAARNPEEMERVVKAQVDDGADWIKLYTGLSRICSRPASTLRIGTDVLPWRIWKALPWPDALAMGLDGIVHLMPLSPDLLTPAQRKAWQATARGGTYTASSGGSTSIRMAQRGSPGGRVLQHRPVFDAHADRVSRGFCPGPGQPVQSRRRPPICPPSAMAGELDERFTFAIGWAARGLRRARAIWPKVQRLRVRVYATDGRITWARHEQPVDRTRHQPATARCSCWPEAGGRCSRILRPRPQTPPTRLVREIAG